MSLYNKCVEQLVRHSCNEVDGQTYYGSGVYIRRSSIHTVRLFYQQRDIPILDAHKDGSVTFRAKKNGLGNDPFNRSIVHIVSMWWLGVRVVLNDDGEPVLEYGAPMVWYSDGWSDGQVQRNWDYDLSEMPYEENLRVRSNFDTGEIVVQSTAYRVPSYCLPKKKRKAPASRTSRTSRTHTSSNR